jgi:hypothetical protein
MPAMYDQDVKAKAGTRSCSFVGRSALLMGRAFGKGR